ncbi:3-demethylubiquinone-9 3-methyltransferase [Legionella beliardensis]|uniref:3-demethylubiquinone-9 3-methyltransferase n=1 Tax=Legionella beliardensis TaxID=91822 RepID=A0A378I4W1_9GAMM|nr:class I SAM-dependent methyltransferase [Legionella beliardensis]STX29736.1 3-demethylubiquinone-9 3-methyltransferase [Legionella beliardensis]
MRAKHSADYFGRTRNFWWNNDFLKLMGQRWDLSNVQRVLDVGCGVGHWGFMLNEILPETATLAGIDREPDWVKDATERAYDYGLSERYSYQQGDANNIPFEDNTFDMVTCQTLLIHVANVDHVLSEMIRVLKPGGLLVTVEPNNIARSLCLSTLDLENPVDDIIDIARFQLLCERGKFKLGEGYISIGDQLPGFFVKHSLKDIKAYMNDRVKMVKPDYKTEEEQAIIEELKQWSKNLFWIWNKKETKRFYLAGGGEPEKFEVYWDKALDRQNNRALQGIEEGEYATVGGKLNYCISGRK